MILRFLILGVVAFGACGGLLYLAFNYLIPYSLQANLLAGTGGSPDESFKQDLDDWLKLGIIFGIAGAGTGAFGIILLIKGRSSQQAR